MYNVKVTKLFKDIENDNIMRKPGDIISLNDEKRFRTLMGDNDRKIKFVDFVSASKKSNTDTDSKKIVIFQDYLYFIGGIETFLFNLTKNYQNKDITIISRMIETEQMKVFIMNIIKIMRIN